MNFNKTNDQRLAIPICFESTIERRFDTEGTDPLEMESSIKEFCFKLKDVKGY